jgi:hypothetical protein
LSDLFKVLIGSDREKAEKQALEPAETGGRVEK